MALRVVAEQIAWNAPPHSFLHVYMGGEGLFINSQTRPLHANEGNQATRKGTSPPGAPSGISPRYPCAGHESAAPFVVIECALSEFRRCNAMATLPGIGAKATNGSNAIPEAGSSWPSWPRASDATGPTCHEESPVCR